MSISSVATASPLAALQPQQGQSVKKTQPNQQQIDTRPPRASERIAELPARKKAEIASGADPQVLGKYRASQPADAQAPRVYSEADREALLAAWGSSSGEERFVADYDLNSDGRINSSDLAALLGSFKPGGAVGQSGQGAAELSLEGLRAAWGTRIGDADFDPSYDFNNDGLVDTSDLAEYLGNQTQRAGGQDEPDVASLLSAFGSRKGEEGYDPAYDRDGDGRINSTDLAHFLGDQGAEAADAVRQNRLQRLLDSFGSRSGQSGFNGAFDFDGDGYISSADLAEFLGRSDDD